MDLVLVRYQEDFGRMGSLDGIFVCTKDELDKLDGAYVSFGEALGKHSEVYTDDALSMCTTLDISEEDSSVIFRVFGEGTISGFNPLDYLDEGYGDEDYEDEDDL